MERSIGVHRDDDNEIFTDRNDLDGGLSKKTRTGPKGAHCGSKTHARIQTRQVSQGMATELVVEKIRKCAFGRTSASHLHLTKVGYWIKHTFRKSYK